MKYAIIRFGGKQFNVKEKDKITLEVQSTGDNEVLFYSEDGVNEIGTPVLSDVKVKLKKIEDTEAKKIRVGRFKSKSRYKKFKGHTQPISIFEVENIKVKGGKE